jgi:hypothetical protein
VGRPLSPVIIECLHLSFLHNYLYPIANHQSSDPAPPSLPLPLQLHASPAHSCCHLSDRARHLDLATRLPGKHAARCQQRQERRRRPRRSYIASGIPVNIPIPSETPISRITPTRHPTQHQAPSHGGLQNRIMDLVRGSLTDCRKSIVGLPSPCPYAQKPEQTQAQCTTPFPSPLRLRVLSNFRSIELTNLRM